MKTPGSAAGDHRHERALVVVTPLAGAMALDGTADHRTIGRLLYLCR